MIPRIDRFLMRWGDWVLRGTIVALVIFIAFVLSGCAAMKPQTPGEWAFHTANLADTLQTISHGSDPCYVESNALTGAALGEHPSAAETIVFMAGVSVLHRFVSWELQRNDVPAWVQRTWEGITFTGKALTVHDNYQNGVRIFGANRPVEGCV